MIDPVEALLRRELTRMLGGRAQPILSRARLSDPCLLRFASQSDNAINRKQLKFQIHI